MVVTVRLKPSWVVRAWAVRGLTAAEDFLRSHWRRPKLTALWPRMIGAAAGLVLSATITADLPAARIRPISYGSTPDPRIARLEKFFEIYHCPAPHHTSEYLRAADDTGLDYRLLPAVSIRETLCGRTERQPHNPWGYHQERFPAIEVGIAFLARRLTQHPLYRGKTLQDKLFTYNPRAVYPQEVERLMRQIE